MRLTLVDAGGNVRARADVPFAILPVDLASADPVARAAAAGVRIVERLDAAVLADIRAGARVLLVADGPEAIDPSAGLGSAVRIHPRSAAHPTDPGGRSGVGW